MVSQPDVPAHANRPANRSPARAPSRAAWASPVVRSGVAPQRSRMRRVGRATAGVQGAFWLATGLWPIVHYDSFEAVTGPKRDDWLVKTVGGLVAIAGATLLASSRRAEPAPEAALLGAAGAAALAWVDVHFVARKRISKVYLLDVLAEAPFLAGWAAFGLWRLAMRRAR